MTAPRAVFSPNGFHFFQVMSGYLEILHEWTSEHSLVGEESAKLQSYFAGATIHIVIYIYSNFLRLDLFINWSVSTCFHVFGLFAATSMLRVYPADVILFWRVFDAAVQPIATKGSASGDVSSCCLARWLASGVRNISNWANNNPTTKYQFAFSPTCGESLGTLHFNWCLPSRRLFKPLNTRRQAVCWHEANKQQSTKKCAG